MQFKKNATEIHFHNPVNKVEWYHKSGDYFLIWTQGEYPSNSDKYVTFILEDQYSVNSSVVVSLNVRLPLRWTQLVPHQAGFSVKLINTICSAPSLLQRSRSTYRRSCRRRFHPWWWVLGTNLTPLMNHVCNSERKGMLTICQMVGCGLNLISEPAGWN
jgi:hypothetical protein